MLIKRLLRWTAILLVLVAAIAASAIVVAQSDWGQRRARDLLVSKAASAFAGNLSVRSLTWSLDGHARLQGVTLVQDGETMFSAETIDVRYRPWRILTTGVALEEVIITEPRINVTETQAGWNVGRIFKPRKSERPANVSFSIDRLRLVDGLLNISPADAPRYELAALNVDGDLGYADQVLRSVIAHASLRDIRTGVELRQLATELRIGDRLLEFDKVDVMAGGSHVTGHVTIPTIEDAELDINLSGEPLVLTDVAHYTSFVRGIELSPRLRINARGTSERLTGDVQIESTAGNMQATFSGGFARDNTRFTGNATMADLNLAPWLQRADLRSQITGRTTFDVSVPRDTPSAVTVRFDANAPLVVVDKYRAERVSARGTWGPAGLDSQASGVAYGSAVKGRVRWDSRSSTLATNGTFANLDLRRLPAHLQVPTLQSDAGGTFDLSVHRDAWRVDTVLDQSVVEDARIARGTIVKIDARQQPWAYEIRGGFANVDPDRFKRTFTPVPPALERLHGRINAHLDLAGRGTTLADADATIELDLRDSVISGIEIESLTSHGSIHDRRVVADLNGELANLSSDALGALGLEGKAEFTTGGTATAHVEIADVTGPLRADTIDGTVKVALAGGHAAGVELTTVDIDASLASGLADIRRLDIVTPTASISASGPLALEGAAVSNLSYRISASDLSTFETLAGRPLKGTSLLEGRIVGPSDNLTTTGSLVGNSLVVDSIQALSVAGTFNVSVKNKDWRHSNSKFDGNATFVQIGGTEIKTAIGTVSYDGVRLEADATVEQEERSLTFTGSMIPHPEHHEVHVTSLAIAAGGTEWRTPVGVEAVAQYSPQQIRIRDLELVHNDARIRVSGTLGTTAAAESPLVVNVEHVPLEDVATLLLTSQKLTGQLDGTARITGEVKSPRVDADLSVVKGTVNGIAFDSLNGTMNYSERQLGMNVRLEAGTSGRLTAEGTMPIGGAEDPATPPYNLRVRSDSINLALFQPLVTHLEQLQGAGSFDLTVTGPASAPLAHGEAAVSGAGFTMAVTGVRYPRLDARVVAEGDLLNVKQFELHDLDGHVATIGGTLKISERGTPGAFNLRLTATDFHILKNQFGDLSLTPDLRFSGDLQSPLVVGTIHVERGRLEVSDLLERFGASGYRKVEDTPSEKVAKATGAEGPAGGASFSIALEVPDNLVLRGRDMRGPRGSIGLGDVNLTLGGAVTIAKDPTGPMTLVGGLQVARGSYSFQGRRFTILPDSTIHFRGDNFLDPDVDVYAERQISGVTANVHVTGTARVPEIALSSNPSLDQGDILSLIVFNQTMNQLPTAQRTSLATRAGTLAARALATPIADSVARALDFDLFEITPTEDVSGGAILTVGRQVSDRLFVGFRQEFGPDDSSQVSFEYRLNQFLKVVTSFAQGSERERTLPRAERAAADFIFVIRR